MNEYAQWLPSRHASPAPSPTVDGLPGAGAAPCEIFMKEISHKADAVALGSWSVAPRVASQGRPPPRDF